MAKPTNLASLKFSGTFLVFNAYNVHNIINKNIKAKGPTIPVFVVLHANTARRIVGNCNSVAGGSNIMIAMDIPICEE